jgi:hypothetical protein
MKNTVSCHLNISLIPIRFTQGRERKVINKEQLRQEIIKSAARIANNDGRLTADSSAELDNELDFFECTLDEYVELCIAERNASDNSLA